MLIKVKDVLFSEHLVRGHMVPVYLIIGDVTFGHVVKLVLARLSDNQVIICPFITLSNLKELNFQVKLSFPLKAPSTTQNLVG